jgi:hypothetical protein
MSLPITKLDAMALKHERHGIGHLPESAHSFSIQASTPEQSHHTLGV